MSAKVIEHKDLGGGKHRLITELDGSEMRRKCGEVVELIQMLSGSDEIEALAIAQTTLDALKNMFKVSGEVVVSEHRPQ